MKYSERTKHLLNHEYIWTITGVAGFIGSNLLEKLLIFNQTVIGIDDFSSGSQTNISRAISEAEKITGRSCKEKFILIEGSVEDLDLCHRGCAKADYVLHHAAIGSVEASIDNPIKCNSVNITGFINILIASREAEVQKVVYASSSAVYGDEPSPTKKENKIGNLLSPYAVTKVANELYAKVFSDTYGMDIIGLRYFNIFGKRQDPNGAYAAVIPKWIYSLLEEKPVIIYGDGSSTRDFCHVDNVVQANVLAAFAEKSNNAQIYNVATGQKTDLKHLFKIIQQSLLRKQKKLKELDPSYQPPRSGDIQHSHANIDKAYSSLGYSPEINILKGLEITMDWYIKSFI